MSLTAAPYTPHPPPHHTLTQMAEKDGSIRLRDVHMERTISDGQRGVIVRYFVARGSR